jgi:hypothetical protein
MDSNGRVTSSLMRSTISSHFWRKRGGGHWEGYHQYYSGILLTLALLTLPACASRTTHLPTSPAAPAVAAGPPYFIDLQPGWRLHVVTPILKSGGYRPKLEGEPGSTTLSLGTDFLGYEVAWYAVTSRRIVFTAAEVHTQVHNKDTVAPAAQPRVLLFRLPGDTRNVRLIYLLRVSAADHDMAVVAAHKKHALEPLTAQVRANPDNCRSGRGTFCAWIPDGIAVTPEMRTTSAAGAEQWVPAK